MSDIEQSDTEAGTAEETPDRPVPRRRGVGLEYLGKTLAVPALLAAYFLQPEVAKWSFLTRVQIVFALMASFTILAISIDRIKRWANVGKVLVVVWVILSAAMIFILWPPLEYSEYNDARCASLEGDMLSAHPRRSDSHDLFTAFGCRPSLKMPVHALPTDREKKAGHPLPWGGYPPSIR